MKLTFLTTLCLLFFFISNAQIEDKNSLLYIEITGNSGWFGLNYERIIPINKQQAISLNTGIGFALTDFSSSNELGDEFLPPFVLPIQANYNYHFLEKNNLKLGVSLLVGIAKDDNEDKKLTNGFTIETTYRRFVSDSFFGELGVDYYLKELADYPGQNVLPALAFGIAF